MTNEDSDDQSTDDGSLSPDDVYEVMEPFEPYTLGDLADRFDATKERLHSLLRTLDRTSKIRTKESEPNQRIWIREPPAHRCSNCDYEFQIKLSHPILGAVQFCPRCGTQLR